MKHAIVNKNGRTGGCSSAYTDGCGESLSVICQYMDMTGIAYVRRNVATHKRLCGHTHKRTDGQAKSCPYSRTDRQAVSPLHLRTAKHADRQTGKYATV
jgi:hypothetical protein